MKVPYFNCIAIILVFAVMPPAIAQFVPQQTVPSQTTLPQTAVRFSTGKLSPNELQRARPYKKGTFIIKTGKYRGTIIAPKHDTRGLRWLETIMQFFLQGTEIKDFVPIQVGTIIAGSHGTASVLALLMDEDAREMLKTDKKQNEKLNEIISEFRSYVHQKMNEYQAKNVNITPVARALYQTSVMEQNSLTLQEKLQAVLKPEQYKQAKETVFQLYGGFNSPVVDIEILTVFDLSKEQREKLELVAEFANEKRNKVFEVQTEQIRTSAEYQDFESAMANVMFTVSQKVRDVLTKEQVAQGEELMKRAAVVKKRLGLE
jgi:hypothetical protein